MKRFIFLIFAMLLILIIPASASNQHLVIPYGARLVIKNLETDIMYIFQVTGVSNNSVGVATDMKSGHLCSISIVK